MFVDPNQSFNGILSLSQHPYLQDSGERYAIHIPFPVDSMEQEVFNKYIKPACEIMADRNVFIIPYVAGGWVRDKLLNYFGLMNKSSKDIDIAVWSKVPDVQSGMLLAKTIRQSHGDAVTDPIFVNDKGTARMSVSIGEEWLEVEFCPFRSETYDEVSNKPQVNVGTMETEVYRRDFTINSLLYNINTGNTIDYTNQGIRDLQQGIIRTTRNSESLPHEKNASANTFYDDPDRIMRAFRFAATLKHGNDAFQIDSETLKAIQDNNYLLNIDNRTADNKKTSSAEENFRQIYKIFSECPNAKTLLSTLTQMADVGALQAILGLTRPKPPGVPENPSEESPLGVLMALKRPRSPKDYEKQVWQGQKPDYEFIPLKFENLLPLDTPHSNRYHHLDIWPHIQEVMGNLFAHDGARIPADKEDKFVVIMAALGHDLGKFYDALKDKDMRSLVDQNRIHQIYGRQPRARNLKFKDEKMYPGHVEISEAIMKNILDNRLLGSNEDERIRILGLIRLHDALMEIKNPQDMKKSVVYDTVKSILGKNKDKFSIDVQNLLNLLYADRLSHIADFENPSDIPTNMISNVDKRLNRYYLNDGRVIEFINSPMTGKSHGVNVSVIEEFETQVDLMGDSVYQSYKQMGILNGNDVLPYVTDASFVGIILNWVTSQYLDNPDIDVEDEILYRAFPMGIVSEPYLERAKEIYYTRRPNERPRGNRKPINVLSYINFYAPQMENVDPRWKTELGKFLIDLVSKESDLDEFGIKVKTDSFIEHLKSKYTT